MDLSSLHSDDGLAWQYDARDKMRVPAIFFGDEPLIRDMDEMVFKQAVNVAGLPGIIGAAYVMPDGHWGYGFPIGGVAAFDPEDGGIVSGGGVGFDISCGVRTLLTGLTANDIRAVQKDLAEVLFTGIPAGMGSHGEITLDDEEMSAMLDGGARWAVEKGWGLEEDLNRTEENGQMLGAVPAAVSADARRRQRREMGTLGSGNHYLEVQEVSQIFDEPAARVFGLRLGDAVVTLHCGSRGLGHQIGTEYLREMAAEAASYGIDLPDRELACAPIRSELGERYIGAMRAGINCALANREILTHLTREIFARLLPQADLRLLYDVSHNTCKEEWHEIEGKSRRLYVHRKGATRALGPGHPTLPEELRAAGQPVLIGGSMGTGSYVLAGMSESEARSLSSACHGAGRQMSRRRALKTWSGRQVVDDLAEKGIIIRSISQRGVAEEAPGAYKDVSAVVRAAEGAGLARRVAYLKPLICIKG